MINIILKWNPISTQNAYWQHWKIRYMKEDAKQTKNSYILQARCQYKGKPLKTLLSAYIRIYFKDKRVRDWDNWHKISFDALTWILYYDDKQIKLSTVDIVDWYDKDNPRIELYFDDLPNNT